MATNRIPVTTPMCKSLKRARENANITQGALAKKANVPRARIKRIECLELSSIDHAEYARLSKALGLAFKSAPKAKVPQKSKAKLPKRAKASKPKSRKMTRKQALARLEKAGLADLTVRELLSLAS
jgi:transcriptional regulator with XRE-family HTH domain